MNVRDLGQMDYRQAWALQEQAHADVMNGGQEQLFLVEHPPVITFGRRPGIERNLLASAEMLADRGVQVVPSDRGGDITFHGPGQLVAYPIIRLADHGLSVGAYVHLLEKIIIEVLQTFGVGAQTDPLAVGVWTSGPACSTAKVCAIGVRIRRGVTLHGLALNVTTDLGFFDLIVPCGLTNRTVTSLQQLLGDAAPPMATVKRELARQLQQHLAAVPSRS
jgi:lipoyl(octanoyl) transferase